MQNQGFFIDREIIAMEDPIEFISKPMETTAIQLREALDEAREQLASAALGLYVDRTLR